MEAAVKLGLKYNKGQFILLVLVNALVGAMVGMERSIFAEYAQTIFGLTSQTSMLSFIVAFGLAKAITNYFSGRLTRRLSRKNLLVLGWLFILPVPAILLNASAWSVVVFANVLLGIGQGFAWSSTVVMKIDLVGEKDRGLAMGLNEFSGYLAVGLMAYVTGFLAQAYGVVPYPFYAGIWVAAAGLLLSVFMVRDTSGHMQTENSHYNGSRADRLFWRTTVADRTLSSVTQAGLVNNLNDGMVWGLLPVWLTGLHFNVKEIAVAAFVYPAVWGMGQLVTGKMADHYSKKKMIVWGMALQGVAIAGLLFTQAYYVILSLAALLGLGTALVYPTFLVTIAAVTHPQQRAESLGIFRFWRDMGYVAGALMAGILADFYGTRTAIASIALLTMISSMVVQIRMPNQTE